MKSYILLAMAWSVFFCLHSVMASKKMKAFVKAKIGDGFKLYRIAFNVISIVFLSSNLYIQFIIKPLYIFTPTIVIKILGVSIVLAGLLAMFLAFRAFNTKEFLGIQQLSASENEVHQESFGLTKTGFYGLVRHPLYFATLLLIIGAVIFLPTLANLVFLAIVILYLPIGVYFEEKKLIGEFGDAYIQYQKEVKAVIPFLW